MDSQENILEIRNLQVDFTTHEGLVSAVKNVSLQIGLGECVGIVGESGSGKTQTFMAAMGLLAANGKISGDILFKGNQLNKLSQTELNKIRGREITIIFQDPLTSLAPHLTIGDQLMEVLTCHQKISQSEAKATCLDWLKKLHLNEAERRLHQFPHELSGGMRQKVMIAMAMLCSPYLIIADEPTTALDVTVQCEILDLLLKLKREHGVAIALITHDMGVIARMCDRIYVMKDGKYVESGSTEEIFYSPKTDYTRMLLESMPTLSSEGPPPLHEESTDLLAVKHLQVNFKIKQSKKFFSKWISLKAVNDVSFNLYAGETLGIVGESGCGKSTLARAVLGLVEPVSGSVVWLGENLREKTLTEMHPVRKNLQMVFQDPFASLNPRITVADSIMEPLKTFFPEVSAKEKQEKVIYIMKKVGLPPSLYNRYPHELSGGQNQRVGIARAIILNPKLVICDEAVSALDVSVQSQVTKLLLTIQQELKLSLIFISHDLSVVKQMSHRILVMYLGNIVEIAAAQELINNPIHPYTNQLISAVPLPDPIKERKRKRYYLKGELTSPLDQSAHLRFLPSKMNDPNYIPTIKEVTSGHFVAEHDPIEALIQ